MSAPTTATPPAVPPRQRPIADPRALTDRPLASAPIVGSRSQQRPDLPKVYLAPIGVDETAIDTYQRHLDQDRVQELADHWDPRLAGMVTLSDRGPGHPVARYWVIDGAHRVSAVRILNPRGVVVAAVHTGLTVEDEAQLHLKLDDTTRKATGLDRWRARRVLREPTVLGVEDVIRAAGFTVDDRPKGALTPGAVRCLPCCERIYRRKESPNGPLLLANTFRLIHTSWKNYGTVAVEALTVQGVAALLAAHDASLDMPRLVKVMSDLDPHQVKGAAVARRAESPVGFHRLFALELLEAYNRADRGGRLDPTPFLRYR